MRKWILAGLIGVLASSGAVFAAAFNCTLDAACTLAAPCAWDDLNNWNDNGLCNGDYPHNGANTFTATIPTGGGVLVKTSPIIIGVTGAAQAALTIQGTGKVVFSDSSSGRGAEGFRDFTLIPGNTGDGLVMSSTASVDIPASTRFLCDTSARDCNQTIGGNFNVFGTVVDAAVTAVTAGASNAICTAGETMYHTITVDKGQENAKVGRRILFYDGQLRTYQFEITSVSGRTIGFCTYLPDADAATDLTCQTAAPARSCGQRLTPHVAFGNFPDTGPSANTRHWTTAPFPSNLICTGPFAPMSFCTAADTGTALDLVPAVGDHIAIIDDAWLGNTAATNTVNWQMANSLKMPRIYAANIFGLSNFQMYSQGLGTETPQDILFNNVHDFLKTGGAMATTGFKNFKVRFNAFHDDGGSATSNYATFSAVCYSTSATPCPDNVEVTDNIFYRPVGNQIEISSGQTTVNTTGVKVNRNLIFEGCFAPGGQECGGIEVDDCSGCQVRNNVIHDMMNKHALANRAAVVGAGNLNGDGIRSPGGVSNPCTGMYGTDVSFNWIVNAAHSGIDLAHTNGCAGKGMGVVGNYISNVGRDFFRGGNLYGNIARNGSMLQTAVDLTDSIISARGNFFIGNESAMSAYCGGLCSYTFIRLTPSALYMTPVPVTTYLDNVFLNNNYPGPGFIVTGAVEATPTISHNVWDGTYGGGLDLSAWAPTVATTAIVSDNAFTNLNAQNFILCTADVDATEQVGNYIRNVSAVTAENTAGFNGTCSNTGASIAPGGSLGLRNRTLLDYNYGPLSVGRTGAVDGSALGPRVFYFSRDKIGVLWANKIPWDFSVGDPNGATISTFPKNICENGTSCRDRDSDGIIDLYDNCKKHYNPSQIDTDGDGKGDACE